MTTEQKEQIAQSLKNECQFLSKVAHIFDERDRDELPEADKAEKESFCEVIESDSEFVSRGDIVYTDPYTGIKLCETDDAVYILMDEDDILCRKEN